MRLLRFIRIAITATAILLSTTSMAGDDSFWYRSGHLDEHFADTFDRAVVLVMNASAKSSATGVLLKSRGDACFVATNKHVLSKDSKSLIIHINSVDGYLTPVNAVVWKEHDTHDLVLLKLDLSSQSRAKLAGLGFTVTPNHTTGADDIVMPPDNGCVSISTSASQSIVRGYESMFLGFPLGHGLEIVKIASKTTSLKKTPVLRTGKIASKPSNGEFLIDAMSSHGNSGSPVWVRTGWPQIASEHNLHYTFAGIVSGFQADNIEYSSESGQKLSLPHNSGLSRVIAASEILSLLP